ncbi:universal stress protein [Kushneria phosphatilytica]|uniref:Universal stress protein n=1 Tax=Kushneria phosphatilytica TaxID=657387 RepID=A0A1S1NPS1_9GAMM|nr:universal stress protein [Kushneria phosphatilytica]OHV10028.1 hypothetical protein BH688_10485 [Kushneria phosphatilytica]QEL11711.1 universal stress protein [Kushneria phosphatilytica]
MYRSILVPMDGSEGAFCAFELACHLLRDDSSHLMALIVDETKGGKHAPSTERHDIDHMRQQMDRLATQAGVRDDNISIEISRGDPVEHIVREAGKTGVDAIVMGSRGLSNLAGHGQQMGGVSHRVSHRAPCSVLTVHGARQAHSSHRSHSI